MAIMGEVYRATDLGPTVSTVGVLLGKIAQIRRQWDLDMEEALLYLSIGYLNTERIQRIGSQGFVATTNISSVANYIGMPKETARRKINKLIDQGIVLNIGGIVIADLDRWFQLVSMSQEQA